MFRLPIASCIAFALTLVSGVAQAGQADICYGPEFPLAGPSAPPTNATVFECPQAGNKTIPQLAAEGWEIVQLSPVVVSGTDGADQLVIQRPSP